MNRVEYISKTKKWYIYFTDMTKEKKKKKLTEDKLSNNSFPKDGIPMPLLVDVLYTVTCLH